MCNGLAIGHSCLAVSLDLGSLIAGIIAVGAALWAARSAYSSAMKQVEATAKATNDQINALQDAGGSASRKRQGGGANRNNFDGYGCA